MWYNPSVNVPVPLTNGTMSTSVDKILLLDMHVPDALGQPFCLRAHRLRVSGPERLGVVPSGVEGAAGGAVGIRTPGVVGGLFPALGLRQLRARAHLSRRRERRVAAPGGGGAPAPAASLASATSSLPFSPRVGSRGAGRGLHEPREPRRQGRARPGSSARGSERGPGRGTRRAVKRGKRPRTAPERAGGGGRRGRARRGVPENERNER